jgi:hypothetical protein
MEDRHLINAIAMVERIYRQRLATLLQLLDNEFDSKKAFRIENRIEFLNKNGPQAVQPLYPDLLIERDRRLSNSNNELMDIAVKLSNITYWARQKIGAL